MGGQLEGKVAVVIGAARGIGKAVAKRLAEERARLVLGDRDADLLAETGGGLGAEFGVCDVAEKADVDRLVGLALERCGRLDILVQNAGVFPETRLDAISVAEWDRVLAVNLRGCFLAVQAALPPMRAQAHGRIVLTSSITGPRVVPPGHAHYAASKAGINGLIRAAALEAAPFGVTVNGVEPGNIMTEGMRAERSPEFIATMERSVPLGRLGTPRDVANAALFLASDEAAYITGTTIIVDGGQILPESRG
jgi:3-oxoacyl-[acyl-carrier protein] reductase